MEITNNNLPSETLKTVEQNKDLTVNGDAFKKVDAQGSDEVVQKKLEQKGESPKQAENLQVAVSQINDYVQNLQRNLLFTVDEVTGKDVVTVIDSETEEVIRQLPSEEALELARRLAVNKEDGVQLISTQV